jgi:hypothetical protein
MALEKIISNVRTGHSNLYWRLTAVSIDAAAATVMIVLSGYASAADRLAGRQPDDRRDWMLSGPAFAAVAFATAQGATTYDVIAHACYGVIKTTRRPIPDGTQRNEDGSLLLPTGEVVGAEDVDETGDVPTIPSEFADAADV